MLEKGTGILFSFGLGRSRSGGNVLQSRTDISCILEFLVGSSGKGECV